MIHVTTYKSPNGSTLGYTLEVRNGAKILGFREYKAKQAEKLEADLYWIQNPIKPDNAPNQPGEDMNVVRKQQTVTLRSFYGIA